MVFLCMDSARIHPVLCLLLATSSMLEPQHQQLSQYQGPTLWPAPTQITPSLQTPTVTWMRLTVCFASFVSKILEKTSSIAGAVHPTTGQYSYFMTTGYPWTPIKFAGDQVIIQRSFLLNVNKLPTPGFIVGSGQLLQCRLIPCG